MKLLVEKSVLNGTVTIPGSKSHTIRAVAIAALAAGESKIRRPLLSDDTAAAVDCYRALGAEINTTDPAVWTVTGTDGRISPPKDIIDVGNSGTTLRLALGSAALAGKNEVITFTGDEQIRSRPIGPLLQALTDLGAKAESTNAKAPVTISGKLAGGKTAIAASTSQYLSSLLLCTPLAEKDSEINVTMLNEPDYVQMTLDWLDKQAIKYENSHMRHFKIAGGQNYKPFDSTIPADFSSATFFLCAGAMLEADITLVGLDFTDSQPDKSVVDYLRAMGAKINIIDETTVTVKGSKLTGAAIDMNRTPDALPAMAVTAAFAEGTTKLLNVPQARSKETDRISCMARQLSKMGASVEELPEGLIIHQTDTLKPAHLAGCSDHRIVMALSLAGMALNGQTGIDTAEAMNVTFPDYVKLMKTIGANMTIVD